MNQKCINGSLLICCIFQYVLDEDKRKERQGKEGKLHDHSDT